MFGGKVYNLFANWFILDQNYFLATSFFPVVGIQFLLSNFSLTFHPNTYTHTHTHTR